VSDLARARPIYRTVPGWKRDITGVRKLSEFPPQVRSYLDTIAALVGAPVDIASVGPDREQTIFANGSTL
jgi:adenylosuccinate synthase